MTPPVDQRIYNLRGVPVPQDYVLTPGGYRHKSLVRKVKKGFYIRRRKNEIQLVERRTNRIHKREPAPDPGGIYPQIGSGWITATEWNRPAGTTIKRIYTQWVVPDAPIAGDAGQTVFLFNGLQNDSRDEIVQPVLQYGPSAAGGGGGGWGIANWNVAPSGFAPTSPLLPVDSGDTVTGVVTLVSQPNGKFTYVSQFVGYPQIDLTVPEIDELTWACQTLEAYQISSNDDYPASPYTSMTSIEVDLQQTNLSSIPWATFNPYIADGQRSNVSNPSNPAGEIDIFYR
jgi:hypothetical protein